VVIADQGDNGGVSPFEYNTNQVVVNGGSLPYNFEWNNTGYVRYDIEYTETGVVITVYYTDDATWAVTITDDSPCGADGLSYSNDYSGNTILDIKSFEVDEDSGLSDGAVDITVEGGDASCGDYTYEWSGPNGFTASTEDITGLESGWYNVTVTDCSGEMTEGWYWVPTGHRGRNKTDGLAALEAYPNPFADATTIEFMVAQSGATTATIMDLTGKQVGVVFKGQAQAGEVYKVPFDATNLPSGMYILQIKTDNSEIQTLKLQVTRWFARLFIKMMIRWQVKSGSHSKFYLK